MIVKEALVINDDDGDLVVVSVGTKNIFLEVIKSDGSRETTLSFEDAKELADYIYRVISPEVKVL
jgi:hypothetical protein